MNPSRPAAFVLLALLSHACVDMQPPRIAIATNIGFVDAARLALSDAEREWGELPADTVIVAETQTRPTTAIQTARELARMDRLVAVVGHSSSPASLAAAPVYNESEIVELSPQSSASAYSDAGPYSFRLVPPDEQQGRFIAEALRDMAGVERIVVLYVNDDYGRGLRASLLHSLGDAGPRVVAEAPHLEEGAVSEADVELARRVVEEAQPDAIVWLGRLLILVEYLPMLVPAGPEAAIIGSDALAGAGLYAQANPLWRGVWYVDFVDMQGSEAIEDFARRFEERFGRRPSSADALTYDATRLVLEAVRQGASSGGDVRRYLESLGRTRPAHLGVTGAISFEEDGDVARSYVLRRVPPASDERAEDAP